MKYLINLVIPFLLASTSFAQAITNEDFSGLLPHLQAENWKSAFHASDRLLHEKPNDSSDLRALITYINIYSAAGMVSVDLMSHDAFLKNANRFIGQSVLMPAHPVALDERNTINKTFLSKKEAESKGFTTACNARGTSIFCFENFEFTTPIDPKDFQGANVRCGGTLKSVEINPNKSTIWISRLYIENAIIRKIN